MLYILDDLNKVSGGWLSTHHHFPQQTSELFIRGVGSPHASCWLRFQPQSFIFTVFMFLNAAACTSDFEQRGIPVCDSTP